MVCDGEDIFVLDVVFKVKLGVDVKNLFYIVFMVVVEEVKVINS